MKKIQKFLDENTRFNFHTADFDVAYKMLGDTLEGIDLSISREAQGDSAFVFVDYPNGPGDVYLLQRRNGTIVALFISNYDCE